MGRGAGRSVPDGKLCVRGGPRRMPCRLLLLLLVAVHAAVSTGCSFAFTKGPQPEVQPPPPCTTSNLAPAFDVGFAALAVVLAGWAASGTGSYDYTARDCPCFWCEPCSPPYTHTKDNNWLWIPAGVSIASAVLFGSSAIVGFNRTADCRASLESNPLYAPPPSPSPPTSSLLLVPAQGCPTSGDVPRMCSSAASWGSSAVVLGDVTPRGGAP